RNRPANGNRIVEIELDGLLGLRGRQRGGKSGGGECLDQLASDHADLLAWWSESKTESGSTSSRRWPLCASKKWHCARSQTSSTGWPSAKACCPGRRAASVSAPAMQVTTVSAPRYS